MIFESISATAILGITIIFLNPGNLSMPDNIVSMLIVGLILSYLTFASLLFREKSKDEREAMHILTAGRISYLAGVGTLILAIIAQTIKHDIDTWLVISLCVMVFSKLISRIYSHFKM